MNRRCGSSKPTPTPLNGLAMKPGKTRRKVIEGNADTIIRQTTRQNPAAYRQCGGGARRKRRYGKTNPPSKPSRVIRMPFGSENSRLSRRAKRQCVTSPSGRVGRGWDTTMKARRVWVTGVTAVTVYLALVLVLPSRLT